MSKVKDWIACDLRYVGEAKLGRLTDEELEELHAGLRQKHGKAPELLADNRQRNIGKILLLKKEISISAPAPAPAPEIPFSVREGMIDKVEMPNIYEPMEAPAPAPQLTPGAQAMFDQTVITYAQEIASVAATAPARQAYEEEASVEERAALQVLREEAKAAPHEEHDAQGPGEEPRLMSMEEKLSEAAKAFDAMFAKEMAADADASEALTPEQAAAKRDREERASAFIQLAAAASASPPVPVPTGEPPPVPVTVDTHRLRVCSFNACKMRLGNANKPYREGSGPPEAYEGSQKGAELTQKWLTLSAIMSDFDVIMLQEVPGTEKVMNEKIEKFAAMLDVATEEGRLWTAINSEKSGKDGQVTGHSAEVHVCFVKSPVTLKKWNTLRKVGCTELDYAPLQVVVHDPRFAEASDRDFVITSVHLPPSKRRDARDSQIAALLRNYAAPDTSEHRMQLPFGPNKETKQAPVHLICGDFNTYPGHDQYQMQANGFVSKIPKHAATTSGNENYDNVLINGHANDTFLVGGGILQLKDPHNASQSKIGLSDHFPVFVEVEEVKKTRQSTGSRSAPAAELPVVDSEEAAEQPQGLEPVKEEEEAPTPPLAEAPTAIWDRLSEEAKNSNPNYNLDQHKPEFTDDSEEDDVSDALTDDGLAPDLPRVVHDEPAAEEEEAEVTEEAVREVVRATMEKVAEAVVQTATKGEEEEVNGCHHDDEWSKAPHPPEAPPAAEPSTEERPSTPPPPPAPPPDAEAASVRPASSTPTEIPRPHPQEGPAAAPEPEAAAEAEEAPSEAASPQESAGAEEGALEAPAPEQAPEAEPEQSPPPPESARAADGEA